MGSREWAGPEEWEVPGCSQELMAKGRARGERLAATLVGLLAAMQVGPKTWSTTSYPCRSVT